MGALKNGDWVRMTEDDHNDGYKSGDVFRLTGIAASGVRFTDNDGDTRYADQDSGRFEPWTPKVGELVRYVASYGTQAAGKEAVVLKVSDYGGIQVRKVVNGAVHTESPSSLEPVTDSPLPVAAEAQNAPAAPAPLTIRAGCYYKTRDGRKVGPMRQDRGFWNADGGANGTPGHFTGSGISALNGILPRDEQRQRHDLIAEWPAATTNVAATVDALDEEYGPVVAVADVPVAKPKFKVGDRVRVVNIGNSGHGRKIGEEFTLSSLMPGNATYGKFWTTSDGPDFYLDEIELVAPPTPAIVCLVDNGHPLPATRPRIYDSVEAANKEAARLSGVHKGQEFGVFAMTGTPHKVEKTYEHEWQRLAASGETAKARQKLQDVSGLTGADASTCIQRFVAKLAA